MSKQNLQNGVEFKNVDSPLDTSLTLEVGEVITKQKIDKMSDSLRKMTDEIYEIGIKNGHVEMKNKILMTINRDWSLIKIKDSRSLIIKILNKINKIK